MYGYLVISKTKCFYAHPHKSLFCAVLLSANILTLLSSLQNSQMDIHELHNSNCYIFQLKVNMYKVV